MKKLRVASCELRAENADGRRSTVDGKKRGRPTPEQIDIEADIYKRCEAAVELERTRLADLKKPLIALCRRWGVIPDGAEKTKRLAGLVYQVDASWGVSTAIDEDAVRQIHIALAGMGRERVFKQMFSTTFAYIAEPTLHEAVAKLAGADRRFIQRLVKKAIVTSPRTPSLKVGKVKKAKKSTAADGRRSTAKKAGAR